jgi:hypothetical protein
MTEYKSSKKSTFLNLIWIVILVLVVLIVKNSNQKVIFWTMVTLVSAYFFFLFIEKKVQNIKINSDRITICIKRFMLLKCEISLENDKLLISYKREIGPRGLRIYVFKIFNKDRIPLLKIIAGYNGWSNKTLLNLCQDLENNGATLIE